MSISKIYRRRFARFAGGLFPGAKSGKRIGLPSDFVAINAAGIKTKDESRHTDFSASII
jgi:hypothetical protein